jgi:probable addiction module antidote protein
MPKRTHDHHVWLLSQLTDPRIAANYLNEARQESRRSFLKALRIVAEARKMAVVAHDAGVNRESLYKALSEGGNPRLETYDSVLNALGLDYSFQPKQNILNPVTPAPSSHFDLNRGNVITTAVKNEDLELQPLQRWTTTVIEIKATDEPAFEILSTNTAAPYFGAGTATYDTWQSLLE